jgi:hypothetical protein
LTENDRNFGRHIDQIVRAIVDLCPTVKVQQLNVSHPGADDDGLWFFNRPGGKFGVQIESPTGMCPFLIETDESDARLITKSIDETVEILARLLHIGPLGVAPSQ